jgi:hypothetical protein
VIALAPKTYSYSVNDKTTATKCKGYSKQGKLYFKDYFDVYAERKFLQGTNNNMQLKKVIDNQEILIMTNIAVIKISLQQHTLNIVLVKTFLLALRYSSMLTSRSNF